MNDLRYARVEAAGRVIYEHWDDWTDEDSDMARGCKQLVSEALTATDAVVTAGLIAEVLARHQISRPNGGSATVAWCDCSCGYREEVWGGTREVVEARVKQHQARAVLALLRGEVADDDRV